ncbi:alpha-L-fucosidase [Nonomuraea angiospora]|uniref:alpha-L-fucosidase n=1 Tax=Nonomuraea angiospora TaxID=46172 RepID=UPI003424BC73
MSGGSAEWFRAAREAGMRYAVLTAKHHDGFCLFDSALTGYTSVRAAGRDLVAEFAEAMRAEGLRVGLYYSLLDWRHPDFTVDRYHPLRDSVPPEEAAGRDMARYRAYLHGQVRELLTGYGPIDLLLNVGPTGRGALDPRAAETLRAIGAWTSLHARAVHGAGPSAFEPPPNALYTQRVDRLYLHLLAWPLKHVHLPGLAGRVRYAQLLHDGSEVRAQELDGGDHEHNNLAPPGREPGTLTLTLPVVRPDVLLPVVEIVLRGEGH